MPQRSRLSIHFPVWLPRYAIAIASVSVALILRLFLQHLVGSEIPFLLLFAAVLVSAAFGGLGPGLLATLLGSVAGSMFMPPHLTLDITGLPGLMHMVLFLFEGVFISVLAARLQAARLRAEQSEAEARRLEQRILDISDDERRRIGQDLHDGLGQHLTGVAFLSKALQQRLVSKTLPEAQDATKIVALVTESIGQTRALAKGLAPVGLEDGGLQTALEQLAASTSGVFGIECSCHCANSMAPTDLALATHLYRIAQEAINNAVRHAKPTHINISLVTSDSRVRLSIEDDGVGMSARPDKSGIGLQIMGFRARMIGGILDVGQRKAGGTSVTCSAPMPTT